MSVLVDTKKPGAVEGAVQAVYREMFPGGGTRFVPDAFGWAIECFSGGQVDYQAVDAGYHDLEHTLQGALCMALLLGGRHRARIQPELPQRLFELGIIAILFHDTGYLKRRDDREGTGAKYTVTHVRRSAEFAGHLLAQKGFSPADILAVQSMIRCTGVDAKLDALPFRDDMEKTVGFALASADLLGQMAADDYLEKLPELFEEFAEAAAFTGDSHSFVASFSSAAELIERTPVFWERFVRPKLDQDFGGLYHFLNDPYPDGPNPYVERIEANMARLRQRLVNGTAPSSKAT